MGLDKQDWGRWLVGLAGAGISGAAASIAGGSAVSMVAPNEVNMQTPEGFKKLLFVVGFIAFWAFVVSISKYLAQNPLPKDDDEEKKP